MLNLSPNSPFSWGELLDDHIQEAIHNQLLQQILPSV